MDDGLKTLFAMYKGGPFGEKAQIPEEEIARAKEEGYLFDYPGYESHPDMLNRRKAILAQVDPREAANAFLYSLSTRRLEYRSALGSYYFVRAIPEHELLNSQNEILAAAAGHCYLCGWRGWKEPPRKFDLWLDNFNIYNYERYKYGGVRHTSLNYALFDLEQFLKLPQVVPAEEDRRMMREILACVGTLKPTDKAGKLREAISRAKIFRSNKNEVSVLLNILGICGILAGEDAPSYDVYFANEYERAPVEHTNDFAYPVNRWHASDGVNRERLKEVFGDGFPESPAV